MEKLKPRVYGNYKCKMCNKIYVEQYDYINYENEGWISYIEILIDQMKCDTMSHNCDMKNKLGKFGVGELVGIEILE